MSKLLIYLGLGLVIIGLLWPWLSKLPLGRLPGDIAIKGANSGFYFPITTMILISVIVSVLLALFKR